ncbi:sugar transferase [Terasakiella sp. SH-1]|uniref:sugar transferase n=1 Tax=Terasakiella sp. SH-1 TaxID=2560057 RepID=UPI00107487F4|nr:sugar transferase [Terasakiella sp. SH-1]
MQQTFYIPNSVSYSKRFFDLACATIGLILLSPLFPLLALLIKLDSPGPIIFKQLRIGCVHDDRIDFFWMYKFRSMREDAEKKSGPVWASKKDPRVTRIGIILRKTRLDELPQLFNILKGDMSLVGPRPERPSMYPTLEKEIPYFTERTYGIRPGVTGVAQVFQGYTDTVDQARDKVAFDHAYSLSLLNTSSWLKMDLHVLWKTVSVVILGRGQ